ncbi:MAG: serine hydrolase domain-containing protein [Acidobacteriaceae bacterium]
MSKQALLITLVVLLAIVAKAADENLSHPQVDKIFADLQKPGSPGCALGVFRDGKIIYSKGYGLASVEVNAPIVPQTVFDIGSTSKQFTATSILLLERQGKLSLDDDVRKYIPELPDYSRAGYHRITILNLLNHTSGLRDYLSLLGMAGVNGDSVTTDEDALSLVAHQKHLNFAPGSEWRYSNTGYFLLSVIVKRVAGMSLREFAVKNIFQPLDMTHTTFRDDHTMLISGRALAYDPGEKTGYKLDVSYFEQLGDGAVHTSVEDLAKWDENFYSGKLGGKGLVAELQEPGKLDNGKQLKYAKALFISDDRGLRTVRHGGAWGGYRAELLRFPDQHFSVACLCNLANADPEKRADQVAEIFLGSLMKPKESAALDSANLKATAGIPLDQAQMAHVSGIYRDPEKTTIARVSIVKDKLQWEIYGGKFALLALSPTEFRSIDFPIEAKLTFETGADHAVHDLKISGDEQINATYQAVKEFQPSARELATYTGDFQSDELGVIYRLKVVDGNLTLVALADASGLPRTGLRVPTVLRPTIAHEFEVAILGSTVDFLKDAQGAVTGFNLDSGRTQGIQFTRIAGTVHH